MPDDINKLWGIVAKWYVTWFHSTSFFTTYYISFPSWLETCLHPPEMKVGVAFILGLRHFFPLNENKWRRILFSSSFHLHRGILRVCTPVNGSNCSFLEGVRVLYLDLLDDVRVRNYQNSFAHNFMVDAVPRQDSAGRLPA